jgi:hypothetical protein
MARDKNPNLRILELAVAHLGPLADEMVFLGGCATGLLLTDVAAPPIRFTQDVDVITEVASVGDYHRLSSRMLETAMGGLVVALVVFAVLTFALE